MILLRPIKYDVLLLGNFVWMACNFARMAMCLNGLCMPPLMLQLWVLWSELNGINSKIVANTIILHIIMFKILATWSRFLLFDFKNFHKELWLCLSKCCNSSQSSIAYILALMQLHLISFHDNIMCNFSVFFFNL